MALDPNERPPGGGPTYKTREFLEVLAHIVPGVLLLIFAFTARLGGTLNIFMPFDCFHNVRQILGLLEAASATEGAPHGGPGFILHLVEIAHLNGEKHLPVLFCPGDPKESFDKAGGLDAYLDLEVTGHADLGRLTSYAGRHQSKQCIAKKGSATRVILICDDSEDHHDSQGFIVGYSDQSADWRDKAEDWGIPTDERGEVGEESAVAELRCLLAE